MASGFSAVLSRPVPGAVPAGPLPCPFSRAPFPALEAAGRLCPVPEGFTGRIGVLLVEDGGALTAYYRFREERPETRVPTEAVTAAGLWPGMEDAQIPDAKLFCNDGSVSTLRELIAEVFAPFPERADNHGAAEQRARRALWRAFLWEGLNSPSVSLLNAFNCSERSGRPVGMTEMWAGSAPAWDIRFAGTFYPPLSGARFILPKLLIPDSLESPRPICNPENVPAIPVLFEDEALIVVGKPSGIASVPGGRELTDVKTELEKTHGPLHVVHRLDMGTSGVLAFAKTQESLRAMNKAFVTHEARKRYTALLEGVLPEGSGTVTLPLSLSRFDRPRQCVLPEKEGGRACVTRWETNGIVETTKGPVTRVLLYPETGRTHQLRMHCAHPSGLGVPIAGDNFYSREGLCADAPGRRLYLHADMLRLPHPLTKKIFELTFAPNFPLY